MRPAPALVLVLAIAAGLPAAALAQAPDGGPPPADAGPSGPDAAPELEPPRPLTGTDVPDPVGAPPHAEPIVVTVKLHVDAAGVVERVELLTPAQPPFDDQVITAARAFRFEPARFGGKPVPVEITFTHRFLPPPPPPPPAEAGPPLDAILRGRLVEMGTRAPIPEATVVAEVAGRRYPAGSDEQGRFRLPLPAGRARIRVVSAGHQPFVQEEKVEVGQELAVTYYVERDRYDPYEIVVVGEKRREEVSRVTLRGPELRQVPGTFGDPFRVVQTLPGVATVMSLLPFPIVRGSSPSSTGFLLDGTRVPLLFHLLYGPSVVHPDFIDEVEFYPGGAPVLYGGYTGGIVDGRTARARPNERLLDFDANLTQAGGLIRRPIDALGATATAAARYGYPGLVLSLASDEISLSYWDYQLRLDGGTPASHWTVFLFGARDVLETVEPSHDPNDPNPKLQPALILGFHRLDLRYRHATAAFDGTYRLVGGYDDTLSAGADVSMVVVEPSMRWRWRPGPRLTVVGGVEGILHDHHQGLMSVPADEFTLMSLTRELQRLYVGSVLAEALWRPTDRLLLRPGVRGDLYSDGTTTQRAVDPRLTARLGLFRRDLPGAAPGDDTDDVTLKASLGLYHQPPRFVLPLPGLDTMPLRYGLLRSVQASAGAEAPLAERVSLSAEAFLAWMHPTIFDLSVNAADLNTEANAGILPTSTTPGPTIEQEILDRLTRPQTGRAYGLELLLRREAATGPYGWISYTLSRAERKRQGAWAPYDFDRSHLLNVVVGLPLPRHWDLGLRGQYDSGKPATTTAGYNTARTDGYVRVDLRIDKRAVWRSWLLDFYVDVINVALLPEEVTPGVTLRYVLPTLGVRGRF